MGKNRGKPKKLAVGEDFRTSAVETAWETRVASPTHLDVPLNNLLTLLPKDFKEPWLGWGTANKLSCSVGGNGDCRGYGTALWGTSLIKGLLLTGAIP